jgi:hypothetical protein
MVPGQQFAVKFLGRSGLIYSEGNRNVSLHSEMLVDDDYDLVIYLSRVTHWEDGAALSDADKARLRDNLTKELKPSRIEWS